MALVHQSELRNLVRDIPQWQTSQVHLELLNARLKIMQS